MDQIENRISKRPIIKENLNLDNLDMSIRLINFLQTAFEIKSLDEISQKTESEIQQSPYCSKKHLKELKEIMASKNIHFKPEE